MPEFADDNEAASFYDHGGDDRSNALRLLNIIGDRLTGALRFAIRPDETRPDFLFRPGGPLGDFDAKVRAAYSLALIAEDVFQDLMIVDKILRAFDDIETTFESPPIADYIESLKTLDVHRQLYRTKATLAEAASQADRLTAFILEGELDNRKSQFRLCIRFYLNVLNRLAPHVSRQIFDDSDRGTIGDEDSRQFASKYMDRVKAFEAIVSDAMRISYYSGGRQASGKPWWAALLFTRTRSADSIPVGAPVDRGRRTAATA